MSLAGPFKERQQQGCLTPRDHEPARLLIQRQSARSSTPAANVARLAWGRPLGAKTESSAEMAIRSRLGAHQTHAQLGSGRLREVRHPVYLARSSATGLVAGANGRGYRHCDATPNSSISATPVSAILPHTCQPVCTSTEVYGRSSFDDHGIHLAHAGSKSVKS